MRKGQRIQYNGQKGKVVGMQPNGMIDFQLDGESFVQRKAEGELQMARENSGKPKRKQRSRKGKVRTARRNPSAVEVLAQLTADPSGYELVAREWNVDPAVIRDAAVHRVMQTGDPLRDVFYAMRRDLQNLRKHAADAEKRGERPVRTLASYERELNVHARLGREDIAREIKASQRQPQEPYVQGPTEAVEVAAIPWTKLTNQEVDPLTGERIRNYPDDLVEYLWFPPKVRKYKEARRIEYWNALSPEVQWRHVSKAMQAHREAYAARPTYRPSLVAAKDESWRERAEESAARRRAMSAERPPEWETKPWAIGEEESKREFEKYTRARGKELGTAPSAQKLDFKALQRRLTTVNTELAKEQRWLLDIVTKIEEGDIPVTDPGYDQLLRKLESARARVAALEEERRALALRAQETEAGFRGQFAAQEAASQAQAMLQRLEPPGMHKDVTGAFAQEAQRQWDSADDLLHGRPRAPHISAKKQVLSIGSREDVLTKVLQESDGAAFFSRPDPPRLSTSGKTYCGNPIDGTAYYVTLSTRTMSVGRWMRWEDMPEGMSFEDAVTALRDKGDSWGVRYTTVVPVRLDSLQQFTRARKEWRNSEFGVQKFSASFKSRSVTSVPLGYDELVAFDREITSRQAQGKAFGLDEDELREMQLSALARLDTDFSGNSGVCFYWLAGKAAQNIERFRKLFGPYETRTRRITASLIPKTGRTTIPLRDAVSGLFNMSTATAGGLVQSGCVFVKKPGPKLKDGVVVRNEKTGRERQWPTEAILSPSAPVAVGDFITLNFGGKAYSPYYAWVRSAAPIEEKAAALKCFDPAEQVTKDVFEQATRQFERFGRTMTSIRALAFDLGISPDRESLRGSREGTAFALGLPYLRLVELSRRVASVATWFARLRNMEGADDANAARVAAVLDTRPEVGDETVRAQLAWILASGVDAKLIEPRGENEVGYNPVLSDRMRESAVRELIAGSAGDLWQPFITGLSKKDVPLDPFSAMWRVATPEIFAQSGQRVKLAHREEYPWPQTGPWPDLLKYIYAGTHQELVRGYLKHVLEAARYVRNKEKTGPDRWFYDQVHALVVSVQLLQGQYLLLRNYALPWGVREGGDKNAIAYAQASELAMDLATLFWAYYALKGWERFGPLLEQPKAVPEWTHAVDAFKREAAKFVPARSFRAVSGSSVFKTYNPALFEATKLYWRRPTGQEGVYGDYWRGFGYEPGTWSNVDDIGIYGVQLGLVQQLVLRSKDEEELLLALSDELKDQMNALSQVPDSRTGGSRELTVIRRNRDFLLLNLLWPLGKTPTEEVKELVSFEVDPLGTVRASRDKFSKAISGAMRLSVEGVPSRRLSESAGSNLIKVLRGAKHHANEEISVREETTDARRAARRKLIYALRSVMRANFQDDDIEAIRLNLGAFQQATKLPVSQIFDKATVSRLWDLYTRESKARTIPMKRFEELPEDRNVPHIEGMPVHSVAAKMRLSQARLEGQQSLVDSALAEVRHRMRTIEKAMAAKAKAKV